MTSGDTLKVDALCVLGRPTMRVPADAVGGTSGDVRSLWPHVHRRHSATTPMPQVKTSDFPCGKCHEMKRISRVDDTDTSAPDDYPVGKLESETRF